METWLKLLFILLWRQESFHILYGQLIKLEKKRKKQFIELHSRALSAKVKMEFCNIFQIFLF